MSEEICSLLHNILKQMKLGDLGEGIWEVGYTVFVAVILANYWIGYNMRDISPLPAKFPIAFITALFITLPSFHGLMDFGIGTALCCFFKQ